MSLPRASWKGELRCAQVRLPVRLYAATSDSGRVELNQLCGIQETGAEQPCCLRLRQNLVCPAHGSVGREHVRRGYEVEQGRYVPLTAEELLALEPVDEKAIELREFCDLDEVDSRYLDGSYYLAADGPIAATTYAVLQAAMNSQGVAAIGRAVLWGRARHVVLLPEPDGFRMHTLRPHEQVRDAQPYFAEQIDPGLAPRAEVQLARRMIAGMRTSVFAREQLRDDEQQALRELIERKVRGLARTVTSGNAAEAPAVISLRDALNASLPAPSEGRKVGTSEGAKPRRGKARRVSGG